MALADFDRVARILSLVGITASSNDKKLQPHTYLKETLKNSAPNLLGSSAEISQWLSISKVLTDSRAQSPRILETLDKILKTKSFLVGFSFTIADVAVLESILSQSLDSYPEVARWATLVRSLCHCQSVPQTIYSPTVFPVILKRKSVGNLVTEATPNIAKKDKSEEGKEGKAEKKKEKDVSSKKEKVKEKKSEPECKTESENAGGADADLDPSKLEFRVGLVLKCWEHPEAEKLLCEEIDLGESSGPRRIASGLRAHYSPAEIEGRKVIVLANLKDRNMVGFKSQVSQDDIHCKFY